MIDIYEKKRRETEKDRKKKKVKTERIENNFRVLG